MRNALDYCRSVVEKTNLCMLLELLTIRPDMNCLLGIIRINIPVGPSFIAFVTNGA